MVSLLALTACGGSDTPTGPAATVAGVWTLESVNSAPVPFLVPGTGTDKAEITGGSLTLAEGGLYTIVLNIRVTQAGATSNRSDTAAGSYTVSGNVVTMKANIATSVTATVNGTAITFVGASGVVLLFRRT